MIPLAAAFDLALAGGDTNAWDGPLTVSVTAFGTTSSKGALLRSGARPGDAILVTGELGGSIVGHHLDFTPRVHEALRLHRDYDLTAGMDITDGLALDLDRLCQASGCGAVLFADAIPTSAAAEQLAAAEGGDGLRHALSDGEDFELLLTAPADVAQRIIDAAARGVRRQPDRPHHRHARPATAPGQRRYPSPRTDRIPARLT